MRIIAIALLVASGCAAPSVEWRWATDEVLKAPPQSEFEGKPAVYLLKERTIILSSRWREDSSTQWHQHDVIAILNEKGFKYADIRVPYPSEAKFVRFEARTINQGGEISEVAASRVYDDELTKSEQDEGWSYKARVFTFPEVKVGSILEYQYILEEPQLYTSISYFLNEQLPVKRYRLSISGTSDTAYKIKAYNTDVPFKTETSGEYWTITWALDNVAPSNEEPFRLGRAYLDPWFAFVVTRRAKYQYSFDYYVDWNHGLRRVGNDLYFDNDKWYRSFAPQIDFSGCSDKRCRIERAVAYLTTNYRFRGWKNWPGWTAKEATDAKRASGYEKNRLLWWILKREQIDAKFAFVNRYHSNYRDPDHANGHPGNHMILRIEKQDGIDAPFFVDAACEYCKAGELPIWLKDAEAMVVHATRPPPSLRTETQAELVKVSGAMNQQEGFQVDLLLKLDPSGLVEVDEHASSIGRSCMDQKNLNLEKTDADWKKRAEKEVVARFQGGKLSSSTPLVIESGVCKRSLRFTAPGYANLDEGRLLVPLTLLRSKWDRALRGDDRRELQIAFWYPETTTEVVHLEPPQGFELVRWPADRTASAKGVTVSVTSKKVGSGVEVVRSIQIHPGLYDPKNYPEIVKALDTFGSLRQDVVELGPKGSEPLTSSGRDGTPRK